MPRHGYLGWEAQVPERRASQIVTTYFRKYMIWEGRTKGGAHLPMAEALLSRRFSGKFARRLARHKCTGTGTKNTSVVL